MFGFLRGCSSTSYRQVYARCCSVQRGKYGLRSLPFVSYESVFMVAMAVDLDVIAPPRKSDPRCCKTRSFQRYQWSDKERLAVDFAVDFAMLLAKTKLEDDVRDSSSWTARVMLRLLQRQLSRMQSDFRRRDSRLESMLQQHFAAHEALECGAGVCDIEEYVLPTAAAFSDVYRLFARSLDATPSVEESFARVGHCVGAALIAFDCAVDWRRDRQLGHYNPLRGQEDIDAALALSICRLTEAGWLLLDVNERNKIAASVLRHRIASISTRRAGATDPRCGTANPAEARLARVAHARAGAIDCDCIGSLCVDCCVQGGCEACCDPVCWSSHREKDDDSQSKSLRRRRRRRKPRTSRDGFCDCDCGGCDGGCCDCGGCDCHTCNSGGGCEWNDALIFHPSGCGDICCDGVCDGEKKQSKASNGDTKEEPTVMPAADQWAGKVGVTCTPLAPYGMIQIDGAEHPAKSQSDLIEEGKSVVVIGRESFGLLVRAQDPTTRIGADNGPEST